MLPHPLGDGVSGVGCGKNLFPDQFANPSIDGHKLAICPWISPLGEMILSLETTILTEGQENLP
ncbi:hypothetical protein MC7420_1657 [Coleofasciculus chthonoplastes PCC 7420]|uniref:Uncharacterized protein n=1 Tax=Coleofasciculus chthonoplastes PCC 7420 TaxID=118168 RepID=B4VMC1_9CYAN|nr:hypothetical protein [Coleofasciculus chthonoplastes]EDX76654.1 hypothetical protein MC7420_1657 [Coleofasciculus chthonoplastes PCC 7420]